MVDGGRNSEISIAMTVYTSVHEREQGGCLDRRKREGVEDRVRRVWRNE